MNCRRLAQEDLKLIACVTMLLDHFGVVVVLGMFQRNPSGMLLELYEMLRIIGRIAFPIYCFLLVEGSVHTRNPVRYGFRLGFAALIAELPYDLAIYGGINWQHQNVMVTLLLGLCALEGMKRCPNLFLKLLVVVPFAALAELAKGDYGAEGVMLAALFGLTRDMPERGIFQFLGMWFLFSPSHAMMLNWIGKFSITTREWALLSLIPIRCYNGQKRTNHKGVQMAFYLFYPVHLMILYFVGRF